MNLLDGDFNAIIERAKEDAIRIASNDVEGYDDFLILLKAILSKRYNIPLYSEYFSKRTLYELILEIEIWNALEKNGAEKGIDLIKENPEEAKNLFPGWDDLDKDEKIDDTALNEAKRFMETGAFKGE